MKSLLFVALIVLGACASHQNDQPKAVVAQEEVAKKEIAYDGHCAMGLCLKKKVKGDAKYTLEHKDKIYHFSSAEARDKFAANLEENIKMANSQWQMMSAEKVR